LPVDNYVRSGKWWRQNLAADEAADGNPAPPSASTAMGEIGADRGGGREAF